MHTMSRRRLLRTCAIAAAILAPPTMPWASAREQLPLHQTVLEKPGGPARPIYAMPVRIGATTVETGLDTGSIGLRVLPGTLRPGDAVASGRPETYAYGSGVRLNGVVGSARIGFGARMGEGALQLIERVDCVDAHPDCPATRVGGAQDYGLMGQGIPRAGFRAIAGLRFTEANAGAPANPLVEIGVRRYLIDLPRRGEGTGRLVIDPDPQETQGFIALPDASTAFGEEAPANTVPGCLIDRAGGGEVCGAILFDTGAPGITVHLPEGRLPDWPLGTPARLVLGDGHGGALAVEEFRAGPIHYGHVGGAAPNPRLKRPFISVGVTPFLAFSVLYDVDRHGIAVRPRPPAADAPTAFAADAQPR